MSELLPKYSNLPNFVGYPFYYVVDSDDCECHECATDSKSEGKEVEPHVNYDNPELYCFTCSEKIEAAYIDDEESSEEDSEERQQRIAEEREQQRRDEKNGLYPDKWDDCN